MFKMAVEVFYRICEDGSRPYAVESPPVWETEFTSEQAAVDYIYSGCLEEGCYRVEKIFRKL